MSGPPPRGAPLNLNSGFPFSQSLGWDPGSFKFVRIDLLHLLLSLLFPSLALIISRLLACQWVGTFV